MRSTFRAHYPPSKDELDELWSEGLIVLDTNSLLNLFRYSAATRDELLALLEKDRDRVWIPHQVGLEFQLTRRSIAHTQEKAFDGVQVALDEAKTSITSAIDSLKRHPSQEADELSALLEKHMRKIGKGLRKARTRHTAAVLDEDAHQHTLEAISDIYEGHVGPPFSDEKLEEVQTTGVERFAKKIPPGFEDAKKRDERQFGDLVLWLQILEHGAATKLPLIFVTDDGKADWWAKTAGKTSGPRAELVEEYYQVAGKRVHFYKPRRFLAYAQAQGEAVSDTAVEEARKVSTISDFRTRAAEQQRKRLVDELRRAQARDPDFAAISERGRQLLQEIVNRPLKDSKLGDRVPAFGDLHIDNAAHHRASAQLQKLLSDRVGEERYSALVRRMIDEEQAAAERLRAHGIIHDIDLEDDDSDDPGELDTNEDR